MSTARNLLAGLAGAAALTLLHEALKKEGKNMPRVDKIGEEALQKGLDKVGVAPVRNQDNLYAATLVADLFSNALYYSAIGVGNPKYRWTKALALGLTGGAGAVALPSALGLNPTPVTKSEKTKSLTVGYYLFGALVTAGVLQLMARRET